MARSEAHAGATASGPPDAPGPADALRQETLTERDVDAGLALSDAAGWNQTGDDWALFIRHGRTIGLRDSAGRCVATAAALPYGSAWGYVSMVLVAAAWRHRGLASRLLAESVAHLRGAGLLPVLDATPAGAAVYRQSGFVPGFESDRWERVAPAAAADAAPTSAGPAPDAATTSAGPAPRDAATSAGPAPPEAARFSTPVPAGIADLDALAGLDRDASGGLERRFLLAGFLARPGTRAWRSGDGRGFVVARAGRRATQVGPLVASDPAQAALLLDTAIAAASASGGAVFLDLPRAHRPLAERLERQGFVRQRSFVRMSLGASEAPRLGTGMFVLAGPEFG
jgi:GNAT superfamily N-acetyltransferase